MPYLIAFSPTYNLTQRLIVLFGFLIGFPLSRAVLRVIFVSINNVNIPDALAENIELMVMTFLIGFSINLVLMLFRRFISVIQTLFGIPTHV